MIDVYVCGASRNIHRARMFMDRVDLNPGMRITYDWTRDVEQCEVPEYDLTDKRRASYAWTDLHSIMRADACVVLAETEIHSVGLWVELGYAIACRQDAGLEIIVAGGAKKSIFTVKDLATVEYTEGDVDSRAFARLVQLAEAASQ